MAMIAERNMVVSLVPRENRVRTSHFSIKLFEFLSAYVTAYDQHGQGLRTLGYNR